MKCLITDDEPLSLDILEKFVKDVPGLQLAGRCMNAFEAMEKIKTSEVDLVFLDINMPKLSGINMVKSIDRLPMIVFTTAYPQYAVEGFELDVIDYLVKPIAFERFVKAVEKARKLYESKNAAPAQDSFIMVKSDKKLYKLALKDIKYIKSLGDFIKIHTNEKVLICSDTLKNIESQLPPKQFLRIHKSYIVALDSVKYLEGNQVYTDGESLPLGLTYKDELLKSLDVKS